MANMCLCPAKHHGILHRKYILRCCDKCLGISMPCQEKNTDAKKRVQQYIFMFTEMYNVVMFMAYAHMKNKQYVICVTLILVL